MSTTTEYEPKTQEQIDETYWNNLSLSDKTLLKAMETLVVTSRVAIIAYDSGYDAVSRVSHLVTHGPELSVDAKINSVSAIELDCIGDEDWDIIDSDDYTDEEPVVLRSAGYTDEENGVLRPAGYAITQFIRDDYCK
jgi:hypothetical protein